MIVSAPALTPVTVPPLTVDTDGLLVLHVPPVVDSPNTTVDPAQTVVVPVIAAGVALTVTEAVTDPEPVTVYVMIDVPADTPVTTPELLIVATLVLPLVHVPPAVASASVVVVPEHSVVVPVTGATTGTTSSVMVALL